jgi:hypothetical protein
LVIGMDERARAILFEAFATIERSEAQRDELNADLAQRALNNLITGVPKADTKRRELPPVIYKTTQQPEPKAATMDTDTAAGWEAWLNARLEKAVQKRLEDFAMLMGEEAALQEKRVVTQAMKEIQSAIDTIQRLDLEIAALRNEVAILRTSKNVTPLRPRDVA